VVRPIRLWQDCGSNKKKIGVVARDAMQKKGKWSEFDRGCNSNQNHPMTLLKYAVIVSLLHSARKQSAIRKDGPPLAKQAFNSSAG
jgi:hypothetical protein